MRPTNSLKYLPVLLAASSAAATDGYVGSRVCAGCHRAIFEAYARTPMARSLSLPGDEGPPKPVTVYNRAMNRYYRVYRKGLHLYQSETQRDAAGQTVFTSTYRIEYVVGSGINGRSYLVRRGNHLFQAPLSFYSRTRTWDLSPGYEQQDLGFSRPILPVCLSCHSERVQAVPNRLGLYRDPPFLELGIGCESCHGPGQLHATNPARGAIVNPASLSTRLAEDICMKCHQDGDTRVLQPGKDYSDIRPGRPLHEALAIFKLPPRPDAPDASDLLEHHFSMKLSKCYLASGGKLGCLSCHDPHAPPPQPSSAWYRGKCLSCHDASACSVLPDRRGATSHCAGCHMPKREVKGISHSALTLHRVVRWPGQPYPDAAFRQTSPELPDLIYVNGSPVDLPRLTLLQAYAELLDRQPVLTPRYLALLDEVSQTSPGHPFVLAALGRTALRESDPRRAVAYLSKAVAAGAISPIPYQDLAEALARSNRMNESVRVLEQGIAEFPYSADLHKLLAVRHISLHQYTEARAVLVRYLELFPEDSFMREMLKKFDAAIYSNRSINPR